MFGIEETRLFTNKMKEYVPNIQECLNPPVENKQIDEL
jgi:hypothetical protein